MVVSDVGTFLHMPKTGGMWIRAALEAAGVKYRVVEGEPDPRHQMVPLLVHPVHDAHHLPVIISRQQYLVLRDPEDWYRSYWHFRERGRRYAAWRPDLRPLDDLRRPTWQEFMIAVEVRYPRFVVDLTMEYHMYATEVWPIGELTRHMAELLGVDPDDLPAPVNTRRSHGPG